MVEVALVIVTVVLAMVDSSGWDGEFFWVTMVSIVFINIANAIYQNTVYGMAARLPFKYMGAVILGSVSSVLKLRAVKILNEGLPVFKKKRLNMMAPNLRTSAIYFFITALFVLLACFDTYFALPLNFEKAQKTSKRAAGMGKVRVPYCSERIMPVLIDSDWAYWALSVVLGLTSGYYSSLAMMYCP
ncbi:hypothetical protein HAZT_HAZT005500, partial [Hyalella azteca]